MTKSSSAKGGSASGGKKYIWILVALAVIGGIIILTRQGNNDSASPQSNLIPEQSISHGHGLAVDVKDSNKLYVATHYGLLVLMDEQDLFRVGKSRDDYMGFSPHPTDPNVLFSSGHPARGGNIGIQKSEDGGITWKKISNGVGGPADFHEMAISPVNPNNMYGWYEGALQRSVDGGMNWEIVETMNLPQPISFITDPKEESKLYAVTIYGISLSGDKGKTWQDVFTELRLNLVTVFAIHPNSPLKMIAFSRKVGVLISEDGGTTWNTTGEDFLEDFPVFVAYAPSDPTLIYALTQKNKLHKSTDGGSTWIQIR